MALVAFHTSDAETRPGVAKTLRTWWDEPVDLTFRFLDPAGETATLLEAGFEVVARLDRGPGPAEHPSERTALLVERPAPTG